MKVIHWPRASGRTTKVIEESHDHGYHIVCLNLNECKRIVKEARRMNLDIPEPIPFYQFIGGCVVRGERVKGIIIDNADYLLQQLSPHLPIKIITIEDE